MADSPRRVTITSRQSTASRQRSRPATQEIDDQTGIGDAYMRSLVKSQLRLTLGVLGVLGAVVLALPLLFFWSPAVRDVEIGGLPLPWLVLGLLIYPVLVALGLFYVRQAERTEREFSELVERQ